MTDLLAARSQMAMSLGFHIIFAVVGIGMPVLMVVAEWRWRRSGDPIFLELAHRWAKGTAILFAVGAVSGTVLSFELGLLWPRFMAQAGALIGTPFSLERDRARDGRMTDLLSLPHVLAGLIVVALNGYVLLGGADFGGGVWDLLASGPRRGPQRALIAEAIGPIWEANHVWLILVIVLLFIALAGLEGSAHVGGQAASQKEPSPVHP